MEDNNVNEENKKEQQNVDPMDRTNDGISSGNPIKNFVKAPLGPIGGILKSVFNKEKSSKFNFAKFFFTPGKKFKLIAIAVAIFIVLIAIIVVAIGFDSSSSATTSKSNTIEALGLSENSTGLEGEAYKLYQNYDSMLALTTSQLDEMYKNLIDNEDNRNKYLVDQSKMEYGDSIKDEDKFSLNYKRKLYEHILRTEKYNFNQIKWKESSHTKEDENLQTTANNDLELMVPVGTDDDTLNTILDTASPFLLTNNIPLGMLSGTYNLANESFNNQTTSGAFAYNIIKEAMTRMVIHKYSIKELKYHTYSEDYSTIKYKGNVTLQYKDGNVTLVSAPNYQQDGDAVPGNKPEAKVGGDEVKEDVYWYVVEAYTYDAYIKNEFEHKVYNDSDAQNMTNPTSNSLISTEVIDRIEGSKIEDINSVPQDLVDRAKREGKAAEDGSQLPDRNGAYTFTYSTSYSRTVGNGYTYEKLYRDQLIPKKAANNTYKYDDAVAYNTKEIKDDYKDIPSNRKTIEEQAYKSRTYEVKEQENEDPTNGLYGLSLIDFMDSNENIYNNYINTSKYTTYNLSGIGRYYLKEGYVQIKYMINTLLERIESENTVPWVYGSSLGYETTKVSYSSSSGSSLAGMSLLKAYLRSREGHEGITDENGNNLPASQIEDAVNYRVGLVWNGKKYTRTVGYGIDLDTSGYEPEIMAAMGRTTPFVEGDLIPIEIVDKCEEDEIKKAIDAVKAEFADVELKGYQIHALVSRFYNCGSSGWKSASHSDAKITITESYKAFWNEEKDDKFEELYEKYKDNPENKAEIIANADFNNKFYKDIMDRPTNDGILVTRRESEWMVFSMGYYDSLQKFYTNGLTPGDINLYNSDGSVSEEKCAELTNWFVDNMFSGNAHMRFPAGSMGGEIGVNPSMTSFMNYTDYPFMENGLQNYQCTWWARVRASLQAQLMDPDHLNSYIHTSGNGCEVAYKTANYYHVEMANKIEDLKPNSIISFNEFTPDFPGCGHVAYVEAVDYDNRVFYISHCGGGKGWYGITKRTFDRYSGGNAGKFGGAVAVEDIVNSDVYQGGNR